MAAPGQQLTDPSWLMASLVVAGDGKAALWLESRTSCRAHT